MSEPVDPEGHNAAEDLDEDRLRLDPLEEGMDPPERWSPAIDHDDAEPRDLEERLREEQPERPDTVLRDGMDRRDAVDRMDAEGELSGRAFDEDGTVAFERDYTDFPEEPSRAETADERDPESSVARMLRTPPRPAE
ncbi:hypothetical protein [Actinophytocola sp.]|uniref:hypothetical protein n=1 Tax=Actinophytocola sp. TaxID=1872138 RepID=UPI003899E752